MSTTPIPIAVIQGNNYSGVSVNRRDNGLLLFSGSTSPAIHVNGEGNFVSGLRGGLVQEGDSPNFWMFLQSLIGSVPLHLTRISVIPPVITTSAPTTPAPVFPNLPGLAWDIHMYDEFQTLIYNSNAPGYESRISKGPTQVMHVKMHYNFLRQNFKWTYSLPAVLTQTSAMSIGATMNVDLSISDFRDQSPRWSARDGMVMFCAGTDIYKLDPVLGTAASVFTAPDGNTINLSNVVGNTVLAFTGIHIYKLDTLTMTVIQTWAVSTFSPLLSFIQVMYDAGTNIAWTLSNRTSVGVDVYKINLVANTFTRITFTGTMTNWKMVINPVSSTLDLISGANTMSISIPSGSIATGTTPRGLTGAIAADPDGRFWVSDDFATDSGTPSYVIDTAPNVVLTVGTYYFGFTPPGVPRAQGYAFANVTPTIVGPMTYPVSIDDDELSIIRGFWRAQRGDAVAFTLPVSKLTGNPADPDLKVRFERGGADFNAFLHELYDLQEISFIAVLP